MSSKMTQNIVMLDPLSINHNLNMVCMYMPVTKHVQTAHNQPQPVL